METHEDRATGRRTWPWALLAIVVGALSSWALVHWAPGTAPTEEKRAPRVVQAAPVEPRDQSIVVVAYGSVIAARQITVRPEVRGRVLRQHPSLVPGGHLSEDEEIIGIDRSDYELMLIEKEAALEEARYELDLEKGRQIVASREWRLLEGDVPEGEANRSLVLREPHLRRAQALVARANNEIAKARLALARTSIVAPFNATVVEESVDQGQLVESGSSIATLVGTDEFWVRVAVPVEKLHRIQLPADGRPGARADVILETGADPPLRREGHVIRLLSDVDPEGRMARLLVSVPDPLVAPPGRLPLLLGSYVRVDIDAGVVRNALSIDRSALRPGDRIWVVNTSSELEIRDVEVIWSRRSSVLISGQLAAGELLVLGGLRAALPGMKLAPQLTELETLQGSPPSGGRDAR